MLILVKHIGTHPDWEKPKDGSDDWIEYWKRHSGIGVGYVCNDCGCLYTINNPAVGAHVRKAYSDDKKVYIVPTCKKCNSRAASDQHTFYCDSSKLVPANKDNL